MHHLWRRLGPAEVLGPIDRECRNPSSTRSKRVNYSSICRRSLVCHLNIFFMHFQMEDMKARESVGGSWCQNSGSSSSSNCSSEEDSAGTSSGRTVGIHTTWRQLLCILIILSGATKTRSNAENTSSGRMFLHRRVANTRWEYFGPRVCCELAIRF